MNIKDELVHMGPGGSNEKAVIKDITISDTLMTITRAQIKADLTADVTETINFPTWNQSTTGNAATATIATTAVNGIHYLSVTTYASWTASKAYAVNDTVIANGYIYKCKTAHTSGTSFAETNWDRANITYLATSSTLSAVTSGTTIAFLLPGYGGSSTTSLAITLKDGTTVDTKPIKLNTSNLTSHFGKDTLLICTCDGTNWKTHIYNTNNLVYQVLTTTSAEYPILTKFATDTNSNDTNYSRFAGAITINPSTGTITSTQYKLYQSSSTKYGLFTPTTLTDNRTWTLPNASGTVALTSQIPTVTNYKWANLAVQSSVAFNTAPEFATMKLGNGTSATATSYCQQVYDSTNKCLKFVFA